MRILIVAVYFPPLNSVAALRPAAWARHLARCGHSVTVLTTAKPPAEANNESLEEENIEVLEVALPFAGLTRAADRFSGSTLADSESSATFSSRRALRRWMYWLRRGRGIFANSRMPDHYDRWVIPALTRIWNREWDVAISTHGPYACHTIVSILRMRGRAHAWIADFRDLWTDNHIFPGLWPFTAIERWMERAFCRRADVITTVSDGLAEVLRGKYGQKVEVIENGVDLRDLACLPQERIFPADGVVRIVYTGTIYESGQNPEALFRALSRLRALARDISERIRVIFVGKYHGGLAELVRKHELRELVLQHELVTRQDSLRMQRDADALIFLSFDSPGYQGILTGKLFEYLASGTEVLSTGNRCDPSTGELIEGSRRGRDYGCDDDAILQALRRIIDTRGEGKFVDLETRRRIDRARSTAKLVDLVAKLGGWADRTQPHAGWRGG